ncbi:MAG: hypothetical protein ACKOE6_17245 [Flammeovirgaceae bacterium]
MRRALLCCSVLAMALFGCKTQKVICPAYQSSFIFDKPSAREDFVHYNENKSQPRELLASNNKTLTLPPVDSLWGERELSSNYYKSVVIQGPALPKEKRNKRTRYLLLPEKTYRKALRALQTLEMTRVYPNKNDSLDIKKALDSAARSINDTLTSTAKTDADQSGEEGPYVISKEKEKFNLDQDYYMWYLRNILVLPDVRIAMEGAKEDAKATAKKEKKMGFFGFFSNLFGKKKKDKKSEPVKPTAQLQEATTVDSTGAVVPTEQPKKKKGLMGLFKKKSKDQAPPPAPKKKEEEEEEKF